MTATAPTPARIDRYLVLGVLGHGGMGDVYLGFDARLERHVAIKVLKRSADSARLSDRLQREALALACLMHPNVVAVHEVGEAEGQVYLVMERVDGVTLRTWLSEQPRNLDEVLAVMRQAGSGLGAAHAAGLIHRDFKPDNVMVGADGRVRVMDFGLARAATNVEAEVASTMPSGRMHLLGGATDAGFGTPGYLAPEQYLGVTQDVRSDVFSFCVVLFEALYGRRPFHAVRAGGLREVILRGEITRVPGRAVPTWLDVVICRGLIADPSLRWSSIEALLAALAHPPRSPGRRLLRGVAALALVGAVGVTASLGIRVLREAEAVVLAEQLAEDRLAATEAIIRRSEATGEHELAAAAFKTFTANPAHRGTRALSRAWQQLGDRRRAAGVGDEALDAYAQAYLETRDPAGAAALMRTMAGMFRARWDGPALAQALATLRARGLDVPADAALALDAALLQGDLVEAAALARDVPETRAWAPLLETLARARATGRVASRIVALPPGGPAAFVVRDVGGHEVMVLDREFVPMRRMQSADRNLGLVNGAAWVHAFADGHTELLDLMDPARPLWRGPAADPFHVANALDLDGDGTQELLFGRKWGTLGFRVLTSLGGAAREQIAHASTEASDSELSALWTGDLDGDGAQEIVAALGSWSAFDLRVFRAGGGGALDLLGRRRFGHVTALTSLRRGDERLLVAINDEHCPSPELFPAAPHTGEPAGVHLLRWDGAALVEVDFLPLPRSEVAAPSSGPEAIAADLDGDGVDELIFTPSPGTMLLVRQGPEGLDALGIHGLRPLAAGQLDDDAAHELLVRARGDSEVWILGVGEEPLPRRGPAPTSSRIVPPSLHDPLLVERWVRADELGRVGLPAPAAASLREVVGLTDDPQARRDLLDHAADLLVRAGDDAGAVALSVDPDPGAVALARDAAALARLGRHDEAHRAALAVLADPARTPAQEAEATALRDRLAPLVGGARVDLDFGQALDPAWDFLRPASLRRNAGRGSLRVALAADATPVAALPLVWDGGSLALEYELDLERLEYGACLRLGVVDQHDRLWLSAGVCGLAGGGRMLQVDRCVLGDNNPTEFAERPVASALAPRHLILRVAAFADGTAECSIDDGVKIRRAAQRGIALPLPGPMRLVIGAFVGQVEPTLAVGTLRRVTIRGAGVAAPLPGRPPQVDAARHLVEGEPVAALAALAEVIVSEPRDALLRALSYHDMRDPAGLDGAAAELLLHLPDPAWRADLTLLLRTQPAAAMALMKAGGTRLLPALGFTWGPLKTHLRDPDIQRGVLTELSGLDQMRPQGPAERHALRRLLSLRGSVRAQTGDREHARGDFEAALAVPSVDSREDREEQVEAHLSLARLLALRDPAGARIHAAAAVAGSARPELVRDRLAAIPGL